MERAVVFRERDGDEQLALPVNLNDVLSSSVDFLLKANDRVKVFSRKMILEKRKVEIVGEVNNQGYYDFFEGMTVLDLILMAEGVKNSGSFISIDLYRQTFNTDGNPFKSIDVQLSSEYSTYDLKENPVLNPNDIIIVRFKEGWIKPEFAEIQGLVRFPGFYSIYNNKYSLYDLLKDSGGILPNGSRSGLKIKRLNTSKEEISEALVNFNSDSTDIEIKKQKDYIEFGVNVEQLLNEGGENSKSNVILKNGDIVVVPKMDNTIEVLGEVERPTVINFQKGLSTSEAINQAGGFTELAKKRGVFVVYQNGTISSNKKILIFNSLPRLMPGAKIIVPKKLQSQNKTSLAEIVGLTSTLATLAVLVQSL